MLNYKNIFINLNIVDVEVTNDQPIIINTYQFK